ncbi:hypothetical protein CI109_105871 [Kwoniella shandongensis]|uniref:Uncharacterized protein n=1 Tax=Kwoniella shandongensis TaxID=1734106 RepID=A0A5M6BT11_9TREE|nr:uncharacterized protein CI109_005694 [Kwoniella shandongensis]KAA5525947.1 hypothetical protein CI109_005694 [Kwoniella shandongensis]
MSEKYLGPSSTGSTSKGTAGSRTTHHSTTGTGTTCVSASDGCMQSIDCAHGKYLSADASEWNAENADFDKRIKDVEFITESSLRTYPLNTFREDNIRSLADVKRFIAIPDERTETMGRRTRQGRVQIVVRTNGAI